MTDTAITAVFTPVSEVVGVNESMNALVTESVGLSDSTYGGELMSPELAWTGSYEMVTLWKRLRSGVRRSGDDLVFGDLSGEDDGIATIKTSSITGLSTSASIIISAISSRAYPLEKTTATIMNPCETARTSVGGYASSISSMKNGFSVYSMISTGIDHQVPDSYDPCATYRYQCYFFVFFYSTYSCATSHSFPVGLDDDDARGDGGGGGGCYYPPTMLLVLLFLSSSFG
ncbi:unnamed protein product [Rotaria socialis]|uniref:Uncharacterized protein n=1 Tax=Rotaria socialis TaxID=392032 RepID=A0A820UA00_9BILA|nr:unnamed protein product [Rotaria socialis]